MSQVLYLIIVTQVLSVFTFWPGQRVHRGWSAATYRGLTVGKSSRSDMIRVLGKPLSASPSADQDPPQPIIWNDYGMIQGSLPGSLAVEVDRRTNRIVGISISPENMSKDEVIKYFGPGYVLMGYEFCEGLPIDAEIGPVYENPRSTQIDYLEYRSKGIAIHLNYQGMVNSIYYVSEPIGLASKAGCKRALESYRRRGKRR